jgi:hypothetical protein
MKTISITIEQAKIALECIEESISMSEFSAQEYECIKTLRFYLNRAEIKERLENAIKSIEGETE